MASVASAHQSVLRPSSSFRAIPHRRTLLQSPAASSPALTSKPLRISLPSLRICHQRNTKSTVASVSPSERGRPEISRHVARTNVIARAATDFPGDAEDEARRQQASRRVEQTSKYFRRLGFLGFWGQLACSIVAAVILAFSVIMTGKPTSPVSTYLTFGGIVAAFVSVFWSFGYMRLADKLKVAVDDPTKAPPRASVVSNLKNGIVVNIFGLGATLLGLQATVGVLVAKALTSTTPMYGAMGAPAGFNPVLALDVFLVQASGNTALAHFLGLVFSLELLRATTQAPPPPSNVIPKPA